MLLDDATKSALAAIVDDQSRTLKHILRARIILLSAERLNVQEVARRAGVSRPAVWRWQKPFAEKGAESLLHDETRSYGTSTHCTRTVAQVLALACSEPPDTVTHWAERAVAARIEILLRSMRRIWQEHVTPAFP